jgi:hypothetical protein
MLISEIVDTTGAKKKCPVMRNKKDVITDRGMRIKPIRGAITRFDTGDIMEK